MLVTNFAYRDMDDRSEGLIKRVGQFARRLLRRPVEANAEPARKGHPTPGHQSTLRLLAMNDDVHLQPADDVSGDIEAFRWRRHPQLLNWAEPGSTPDTEDFERGGRSAAVRGLFLARSGRFEEARTAFSFAASIPSVDLTAIPGFWDLSRSGMLAAVGAYEDTLRFRDASALGARIRLTYRPRSVATVPGPTPPQRSATGT